MWLYGCGSYFVCCMCVFWSRVSVCGICVCMSVCLWFMCLWVSVRWGLSVVYVYVGLCCCGVCIYGLCLSVSVCWGCVSVVYISVGLYVFCGDCVIFYISVDLCKFVICLHSGFYYIYFWGLFIGHRHRLVCSFLKL